MLVPVLQKEPVYQFLIQKAAVSQASEMDASSIFALAADPATSPQSSHAFCSD